MVGLAVTERQATNGAARLTKLTELNVQMAKAKRAIQLCQCEDCKVT